MRFAKIENIAARVAVGALALVSLLSMTASTRAQEEERPYPKMLPLFAGAQALTSTQGCATAARRGSRPDRARPIIATLAIWSKRG